MLCLYRRVITRFYTLIQIKSDNTLRVRAS